MAYPTAVNSQITDSVSQSGVQVLGTSSAVAIGALFQATAQALANAAHNATAAQQQMNITAQATTTAGVARLLSARPAGPGPA
jgi:killing trait domain-containing protein